MTPETAVQPSSADKSFRTDQTRIPGILFALLCLTVASAPVPLGSARPLAWDVLGLVVALLLIASLGIPRAVTGPFPRDLALPSLLFLILVSFVLLQTASFTPITWHNPIWTEASASLQRPVVGAIAIDRQSPPTILFRLMTYAGIFYLARLFGRDDTRAYLGLRIVAVAGTGYAAYGLIVYAAGNATLLWLPKWAYQLDLTSTFVNRNSFATYVGICLVCTVGLLRASQKHNLHDATWRDRLRTIVEGISSHTWLLIALFVECTALFLTHSRGGVLSTLAGICTLLFVYSRASGARQARAWTWMAGALLLVCIALITSGAEVVSRVADTDPGSDIRLLIDKDLIRAIADHPIGGTGSGSFTSVFPMYRTATIPTWFVNAAHNDYLENMLELGLPAALVLFAIVASLIRLCVGGIHRRRRDFIFPCVGLGVSALVAIHATVDFSLQIPAVTATYMFLLGIAVAQSKPSAERQTAHPS